MKAPLYKTLIFLIISIFFAVLARYIERDFGNIDIQTITITTQENAPMIAKIYRPKSATKEQPAPGLLALHGYQSDKEATNTFGALELAKHGFVVLAIDQFGHGYSTQHPAAHKNMSGAENGYHYLKTLPYVDPNKLGIFGHSTGALNAIRIAKQNPDHRAIVGLSGTAGDPTLNNYLLIQGRYEEIGIYRERSYPVKALNEHPLRREAFFLEDRTPLEWNKEYGDIKDGSARKAALVNHSHLGVMFSPTSNRETLYWFQKTLDHYQAERAQSYWYKEIASGLALFFALLSALQLAIALWNTRYFADLIVEKSTIPQSNKKQWRQYAVINIIMTALLYPLLTQWGGANEPLAKYFSFLPLEMGNGIITWLIISAVINLIFYLIWQRKHRADIIYQPKVRILKSACLSLILILYLYLLASLIHATLSVELRFLWPMLKPLTLERLALVMPYFILIVGAFFINYGLILSAVMQQTPYKKHCLLRWTINGSLITVGGLILLWFFHFIPNYLDIGPGFDIIGLAKYGGRWQMMLAVLIPQIIALNVLYYWFLLKTHQPYLGIAFIAMLMTWILVGGQVIGRFLA